jgi:formate hydrogenlyase subunit 3/multisubunit Na+/H+ antiporter MnhD subunit
LHGPIYIYIYIYIYKHTHKQVNDSKSNLYKPSLRNLSESNRIYTSMFHLIYEQIIIFMNNSLIFWIEIESNLSKQSSQKAGLIYHSYAWVNLFSLLKIILYSGFDPISGIVSKKLIIIPIIKVGYIWLLRLTPIWICTKSIQAYHLAVHKWWEHNWGPKNSKNKLKKLICLIR